MPHILHRGCLACRRVELDQFTAKSVGGQSWSASIEACSRKMSRNPATMLTDFRGKRMPTADDLAVRPTQTRKSRLSLFLPLRRAGCSLRAARKSRCPRAAVSRPGLFLAVLFGLSLHGLFSGNHKRFSVHTTTPCAGTAIMPHEFPVPTGNPRRLTATANRLILPPDERSLQVDLVRLDRTVPAAGCVGSREPCPATPTQRAAAQISESIGVRQR